MRTTENTIACFRSHRSRCVTALERLEKSAERRGGGENSSPSFHLTFASALNGNKCARLNFAVANFCAPTARRLRLTRQKHAANTKHYLLSRRVWRSFDDPTQGFSMNPCASTLCIPLTPETHAIYGRHECRPACSISAVFARVDEIFSLSRL